MYLSFFRNFKFSDIYVITAFDFFYFATMMMT